MNFAKSIFISAYMMIAMALSAYAMVMTASGTDSLAWLGVALTSLPFLVVIGWIMLSNSVARTSPGLPYLNVMAGAGYWLSVIAMLLQGAALLPSLLALLGWCLLLLYIYWYSAISLIPGDVLRMGLRLPDVDLTSVEGHRVNSHDFNGKPAVLVFYRGNWCPLCMAQVKEIAARYRELEALGVRVALISPQPHQMTLQLASRFDAPRKFLLDEGNKLARALGIDTGHGVPAGMRFLGYESETVMPTVIILDQVGRIVWSHRTDNHRVRPEPDVFLDVLRNKGLIERSGLLRPDANCRPSATS